MPITYLNFIVLNEIEKPEFLKYIYVWYTYVTIEFS